jgi:arylsulfatase A-like enzyme
VSSARNVSDNLIVVVVGDHGELFGELDVIGHNLVLHEKLLRVPMLVSGIPDVETDGETMTQQIDLTRTLAEVTDVATEQFEGRDIRKSGRKYAVSQCGQADLNTYREHSSEFNDSRFFGEPYTVVTDGEFKLANNEERTDLYRLPNETTDVFESNEECGERLKLVIEEFGIEWSYDSDSLSADFDESQIEQLKDLGYL